MSQCITAAGNSIVVLLASLPSLLPPEFVPDWIRGPAIIFITASITAVSAIVSVLEPMSSFTKMLAYAFKACGFVAVSGRVLVMANALRLSLWARFQRIFMTRYKLVFESVELVDVYKILV